jgi:hypothetical protein
MTQLVIKPSLVAGSTTRWSYKAVRTIAVHTNVQLTAVLLYRRLTAFLLLQRCCISCPPLLQLLLALADLTWPAYTDFPGTQYQPHNACSGQTAGHVKLLCDTTWTCDWAGAPPTRAALPSIKIAHVCITKLRQSLSTASITLSSSS